MAMNVQLLHMMPLFLLDPLTTFRFPALVAFNEFGQVTRLLRHADEFVLQQIARRGTLIEAFVSMGMDCEASRINVHL